MTRIATALITLTMLTGAGVPAQADEQTPVISSYSASAAGGALAG